MQGLSGSPDHKKNREKYRIKVETIQCITTVLHFEK